MNCLYSGNHLLVSGSDSIVFSALQCGSEVYTSVPSWNTFSGRLIAEDVDPLYYDESPFSVVWFSSRQRPGGTEIVYSSESPAPTLYKQGAHWSAYELSGQYRNLSAYVYGSAQIHNYQSSDLRLAWPYTAYLGSASASGSLHFFTAGPPAIYTDTAVYSKQVTASEYNSNDYTGQPMCKVQFGHAEGASYGAYVTTAQVTAPLSGLISGEYYNA